MSRFAPPLSRRDFGRAIGAATITAALCTKPEAASRVDADEAPSQASNTSNDDITLLSATELSARIRRKQISARDVMAAHLAQIERVNPKVNAIVTLVADRAMADAARADELLARGGPVGVLHGLPVAHKDLVDTAGIRTTRGSPFYRDHVPTAGRADRHAHSRRRRDHARQDQHAGVRRRLADVQHGLRRDAQSVRRDEDLRRKQRRRGGGARLRHGPDRRRQRHRRLAAQPGGVLQRRRASVRRRDACRGRRRRGRRSRFPDRWRAPSPTSRCSSARSPGRTAVRCRSRRTAHASRRRWSATSRACAWPGGATSAAFPFEPEIRHVDRRQSPRLRGARLQRRAGRAGLHAESTRHFATLRFVVNHSQYAALVRERPEWVKDTIKFEVAEAERIDRRRRRTCAWLVRRGCTPRAGSSSSATTTSCCRSRRWRRST